MKRFLWQGYHKVAWSSVCNPKDEGGLGIRRIRDVNKALPASHIWNLIQRKETLWVKWIHSYRLDGQNFWNIKTPASCSWGWRKILQLRNEVWPFIKYKIENGESTSIWFDNWHGSAPIYQLVSARAIHCAGFTLSDSIADHLFNSVWKWPVEWFTRFPLLTQISPPRLNENPDSIRWKNAEGVDISFSTTSAWQLIRVPQSKVPWVNLVWYSQAIPKHSFILWLAIKDKLATQDKVKNWLVNGFQSYNLYSCPLCNREHDSIDHLFFKCGYSNEVWRSSYMHMPAADLPDLLSLLAADPVLTSRSNSFKVISLKLCIATAVYMIWTERNNRIFRMSVKSPKALANEIIHIVRLKLLSLRFKRSLNVARLVEAWKLPRGLVNYIDDNG